MRIKVSPSITQDGNIEVDIRPGDENTNVLMTFVFSSEEISPRLNRLVGDKGFSARKKISRCCERQWLKIQEALKRKSLELNPSMGEEEAREELARFLFQDCKCHLGLRFIARGETLVALAERNAVFKSEGMQNLFA